MTQQLIDRFDRLVTDLVQPRGPHSAVMRLEVPRLGVAHSAAAGVARADSGRPARIDDRFHVASVGKTFTATLITRAAAQGAFGERGVDTSLGDLPTAPRWLVERVHPSGPTITLRQLLTHTSGLKDAVVDGPRATADEHGPAAGSLVALIAEDLGADGRGEPGTGWARRRWVTWNPERPDDPDAGMLNWFIASGTAAAPAAAPGERFHYSDTAYGLLGVLLESATGRRYHELQRDWILEPLGLRDTYMAYVDDPGPGARLAEMDVWFGRVPLLSDGYDLSFDWAGGGQVSTVADLCRFLRAVVDGELQRDGSERLDARWVTPAGTTPPREAIGLGLFRWIAGRRAVVGHAGAWGVRVFHDPRTGAYLAGTVNQRDDAHWMADIFDLVEEALS
ncbi:MAG: hypothetical protein RI900_2185 [Actinomycetota bacterium]